MPFRRFGRSAANVQPQYPVRGRHAALFSPHCPTMALSHDGLVPLWHRAIIMMRDFFVFGLEANRELRFGPDQGKRRAAAPTSHVLFALERRISSCV